MTMPQRVSLTIYRGDTFGLVVRVWLDAAKTEAADLTETEVNAQIRATPDSTEVITAFEIATAGNAITLSLPPKLTAVLERSQVFDVQVDWSGGANDDVQTVLAGVLAASPDVTRIG